MLPTLRIALLFLLALPAFAAEFTVTQDGKGDSLTLAEANQRLNPGDWAYLQPGEYKARIEPVRSGESGKYITYSGTHAAVFSPSGTAINLRNKSYIRVIGIAVKGVDSFAQISGGGWNILENNDFRHGKGWSCVSLENTHHNKILGNRMDECGVWTRKKPDGSSEGAGDMIAMHCATYNLLEGNHLSRGGHTLIANNGNYNVIRNNVFDQKWGEGIGYRAMELTANMRFCRSTKGYSLVEGNTFKNMLKAPSKDETTGFKVEGEGHIVRFNTVDKVAGPATTCVIRPPIIPRCQNNRIYNNTITDAQNLWEYRKYGKGEAVDNVIQNNALIRTGQPTQISGTNLAVNNGTGGPDKGAFLTRTKGSGEGRSVAVGDARWFTDGFGVVAGDRVQIGDNQPTLVTEVDYSAATLTFDQAVKYSKGDPVSLPWDGEAPPVGAVVEIGEITEPEPEPEEPPVEPPTDVPMASITSPVPASVKEIISELADKCGIKTGHYAGMLISKSVDPTVDVTCE